MAGFPPKFYPGQFQLFVTLHKKFYKNKLIISNPNMAISLIDLWGIGKSFKFSIGFP